MYISDFTSNGVREWNIPSHCLPPEYDRQQKTNMAMVMVIANTVLITALYALLPVYSQYTPLYRTCKDPSTCYTLYRGNTTWDEASECCHDWGQRLAVVVDGNTQVVVSRLAGRETGPDQVAWVGGRRGSGTKWRNVNGHVVGLQEVIVQRGDRVWCSVVAIGEEDEDDDAGGVLASRCVGETYSALCQFPVEVSCGEESSKYNISGVCHVVSDVMFSSWNDAHEYCMRNGGVLAHSVVTGGGIFVSEYPLEQFFWTGLHRQSWVWILGSDDEVLFQYTNWASPEEPSETGECLVLDLTENYRGRWRDSVCDVNHSYFICEGKPRVRTTTERSAETTERRVRSYKVPRDAPSIMSGASTSHLPSKPTLCEIFGHVWMAIWILSTKAIGSL